MYLKQLIKNLDLVNYKIPAGKNLIVRGISCNSKNVGKDFIFVAIKGVDIDGHKFVEEAIKRGARVVVVESEVRSHKSEVAIIKVKDTRKALAKLAALFYANPSRKLKVIGVTGTNGKTTVTYLLEAILKEAGFIPGVIGTIDNHFKNKVIASKNTTPGALELELMLSEMFKRKIDYVAMEVSSHSLQQERTGGIKFHSAIFTNLTQDHLDYHKTKERYFQAKARLFKNISANAFVVINCDDKYGRRLKGLTQAKVITYGLKHKADVEAIDIKFDLTHTQFSIITPKARIKINTGLIGIHNVYNILAAVAWAIKEQISLPVIKSAIEKFTAVSGRLEKIEANGFMVFVDYAHTEDALRNVITALRGVKHNKIITVFGCGGNRDKTKRPKMGRVVTSLSDFAIITNDNPRDENPLDIIRDIKKGVEKKNFLVILNRKKAIQKALALAKNNDIVLVAGKGHEKYQILKNRVMPFDDCQVVKQCLQLMS